MDNKHYLIYKILVRIVTLILLGVKFGFLYVSYLIANILNITGFVSIIFIIGIWTCFNTLLEFIMKTTISNNIENNDNTESSIN